MVKSPTFEPKKAIGIGLRPTLWERIDAYAAEQGKSRAQVIEETLAAHIPVVSNLRKSQESSTTAKLPELADA
jgi:predicted DNA-binding protein